MQVPTGAWFPLALTAVVMAISLTWHSVYIKRQRYHREHACHLPQLLQPLPPASPKESPREYRVRMSGQCDSLSNICRSCWLRSW